jgi:hypothetical protein
MSLNENSSKTERLLLKYWEKYEQEQPEEHQSELYKLSQTNFWQKKPNFEWCRFFLDQILQTSKL